MAKLEIGPRLIRGEREVEKEAVWNRMREKKEKTEVVVVGDPKHGKRRKRTIGLNSRLFNSAVPEIVKTSFVI